MSATRRRTAVAAAAVALLGIAVWELRMVRPVPMPQAVGRWVGDLYTIYYPSFVFAYRGAAVLPTWNPHQMAGVPFLGNYNGGFLYPPNWLATIVPVHLWLGWTCALHTALAGAATLALARVVGLSLPAAVVAAIVFMLDARFLGEAYRPSYLASIAWIPVVVLCAARALVAPTPWRGALLGAAVALQLTTGIAQHVCYEVYLLALALAVVAITGGRPDGAHARRLVVAGMVAVLVAVGLAAVQLLPTFEVVARAVRGAGGLTLGQTFAGGGRSSELVQLTYVAGPVLGLAILGLVEWRRPWAAAAAAIAIVAVHVAVGSPLYTLVFYRLPGVSLFRMPQQVEAIGFLALGLLAGLGLDVARRTYGVWPAWLRIFVAFALAGTVPLLVDPALRFAATTIAVAVAVAALVIRPIPGVWLVVAALAVQRYAAIENRVMLTQNNDASFFDPPPFVRFLQSHAGPDRVLLVKNWRRRFPYMEKLGTLWGVRVVQDYEPLASAAFRDFLRPFESTNVDRPLFWGRFEPRPADPAWWLLDALAVRYVVVPPGKTWTPPAARFHVVYQGRDARIFESTTAWPRASVAERWRVMPNPTFALMTLHRGRVDARTVAVVDRDDPVPHDPAAAGEARATIVAETNDTVDLDVASPRGGLVVLADAFWPGWRVTVDGVERECLQVDALFRGVTVAPGTHAVRFRYVPVRLYAGAAVSVATMLALALWGIARALDRRRADHRLAAR